MKKILFFFLIICHCSVFFGQRRFDFRFWEDSLIKLRDEVMNHPSEEQRMSLNEDFMSLLETTIAEDGSFKFSWDSVKNFSVLTSPDKLFRIFTWYIIKNNYTVENFGFLQVYNANRKKMVLYPLYDKRATIDYPKTAIGNHNLWYGAVYYKIIPLEADNKTYYTLLGWNGNNLFTNQKIIEILHFKSDMSPVFGAGVFKKYPERCNRVIFEYAKEASMSLTYEKVSYNTGNPRRDPKTKIVTYDTEIDDMIVFEELIPMQDGLESISAFMVPESSLNQGFVKDKGKWLFVKDVNANNPIKPKPKTQIKYRNYYNPVKSD